MLSLFHYFLCRRHIEENIKRHLFTKIGANDKQSKEILRDIFGENGLLSSKDEYDYELAGLELEEKYRRLIPKFVPYLLKLLKSLLEFVYLPSKNNKCVPTNWKNNSC